MRGRVWKLCLTSRPVKVSQHLPVKLMELRGGLNETKVVSTAQIQHSKHPWTLHTILTWQQLQPSNRLLGRGKRQAPEELTCLLGKAVSDLKTVLLSALPTASCTRIDRSPWKPRGRERKRIFETSLEFLFKKMLQSWERRAEGLSDAEHMRELRHRNDVQYQEQLRKREREREDAEMRRQMQRMIAPPLTPPKFKTRSYDRPWASSKPASVNVTSPTSVKHSRPDAGHCAKRSSVERLPDLVSGA
ncbi:hypothetical protein MHYP_G00160260 [Metynnis hypsauchen]